MLGRGLLWAAALSALMASVAGWARLGDVPEVHRASEVWRAVGLATFTGIFAALAVRPTLSALWVVALANKAALTAAGVVLVVASTPGASELVAWDGGLVVVLVVAWLLTRSRPGDAT